MSATTGASRATVMPIDRIDALLAKPKSCLVVYGVTLVYAGVFAAAAAATYLLYLEPRSDLGNMVQVVWSTAHGDILRMTDNDGVGISRLGAHFDPFLALFVPLWWLWPSPLALLVAQSVAVASGALPVFWLARKHLGDGRWALAFATAYLLYPATQFNAYTPIGVHAVSFAIPLVLYAIWFLDEDRLLPFTACALLAATTKEEVAAAVGGLGIWYAVRHGNRRVGMSIFVIGFAWSLVNILIVIPHFARGGTLPFAGRYANVGSTPGGMLHVAFSDPGVLIHQVATWHKLLFLLLILAPFLGLWAFEPLVLIGALPDLVIDLLSSKPAQTTVFYHYTAGIAPFVVAASVFGAARFRHRSRRPFLLLGVVACFAIVSPLIHLATAVHSRSEGRLIATRDALKLIPPHANVSVSETIGGYVSARRVVSVFPSVQRADWVLVGRVAPEVDDIAAFRHTRARLKRDPRWRTIFDSDGVTLFARRS